MYIYLQLEFATTPMCGWLEEGTILRVEWRCVSMDSGGQCVATGITIMQLLSVDSLVSKQSVRDLLSLSLASMYRGVW